MHYLFNSWTQKLFYIPSFSKFLNKCLQPTETDPLFINHMALWGISKILVGSSQYISWATISLNLIKIYKNFMVENDSELSFDMHVFYCIHPWCRLKVKVKVLMKHRVGFSLFLDAMNTKSSNHAKKVSTMFVHFKWTTFKIKKNELQMLTAKCGSHLFVWWQLLYCTVLNG